MEKIQKSVEAEEYKYQPQEDAGNESSDFHGFVFSLF
jgi:hypothetical protein